jgi:histone acetyltransferase 1
MEKDEPRESELSRSPLGKFLSPARRKIQETLAGLFVRRTDTNMQTSSSPQSKSVFQYSLVGYMTLFSFSSPFKKPKGGMIQRVCQVVILPPYQRAGHGKKMLQVVYQRAKLSNSCEDEIVEINVEDPAPAFVALRDSVDYLLFREECMRAFQDPSIPPIVPLKYLTLDYMEPLTTADATHAATRAKITPRQVQIAYEIFKLDMVMKRKMIQSITVSNEDTICFVSKDEIKVGDEDDDMEKKWGLMVKRRLNVSHKEVIGAYLSKEEKKAKLTHLFEETVKHYRAILGMK